MLNLGVVQQDATIYVPVTTRAADGSAVAPVGTITEADFTISKDDGASLTLTGTPIVWSASEDSTDGKNRVVVDLSADSDLQTAGSFYELWWISDATVDGQTVVECLAVWTLETDAQRTIRLMQTYLYPECSLTTQTGVSDGTNVNLTGIVDTNQDDDSLNGSIWAIRDGTDGVVEFFVVTDFTNTNLLATIQQFDGTALTFTPASSDLVWQIATSYADVRTVAGTAQTANDNSADINSILAGTVTNAQGADVATDVAAMIDANNRVDVGSWLGTAVTTSATSNKPEVDVNSISNDATAADNLELFTEGTALGTLPKVNTEQINAANVVGDGNATPWDGA